MKCVCACARTKPTPRMTSIQPLVLPRGVELAFQQEYAVFVSEFGYENSCDMGFELEDAHEERNQHFSL